MRETHNAGRQQLTRRTVLGGLSMLAAASTGLIARCGQALAAQHVHRMLLGSFEITIILDGTLSFPMSFALPGRDKADVEDLFASAGDKAPDGIMAQVNVTLVKTGDALILIDTGGGPDFMPSVGRLADNLEAAGISADAVTHVIFTHAHADHLWGVIDPLDDGSRFPNARHIMTAAEFDYWTTPDREAQVPDVFKPMAVGTARRLKAIAERIEMRNAGEEITTGVHIVDTAGHTPGHVSVLLRSGSEQLMIGGDALAHSLVSFAAPRWRWGSDMDGDRAAATRQCLLDRLASEQIPLIGYHLPWPGIGRVERKDLAFCFIAG